MRVYGLWNQLSAIGKGRERSKKGIEKNNGKKKCITSFIKIMNCIVSLLQ
jgi:hypothetical protein